MILIPSYKPDTFGNERISIHNKQLDWFLENTIMEIQVCAMNYDEEDFRSDSRIHYHITRRMPPNAARVFLKKEAVTKNTKWVVYCDNDAILKDIGDGKTFLNNLDVISEFVDVIFPINPIFKGFNKFFNETEDHTTHYYFYRNRMSKGSFIIARNTEFVDWRGESEYTKGDDHMFALENILNGKGVYECANIVLYELGSVKHQGTWILDGDEREGSDWDKRMANVFGLPLTTRKGKPILDSRKIYQNYWPSYKMPKFKQSKLNSEEISI